MRHVRCGSKAVFLRHSHLRLLSGDKQTSNVCYSESPALMSAVRGKADVDCQELSGPFIANKRHSITFDAVYIILFMTANLPVATPR
jgi:hypothetical protein